MRDDPVKPARVRRTRPHPLMNGRVPVPPPAPPNGNAAGSVDASSATPGADRKVPRQPDGADRKGGKK